MGSESDTIAWIRNQLERLSPQNAHHEFEHLCRRFARAVLTPNILPATGPVSAGGDQGRDFETFHTYTLSDSASKGDGFWATSDDRIAFACSLEKNPEKAKIRNDVTKICEHREEFVEVVFLSSQDIAVGKRIELIRWASDDLGVRLQIFDGNALAERLACEDVFHIAKEYLKIPDIFAPSKLPAGHQNPQTPVVLPPVDIRYFQGRSEEIAVLQTLLVGPEPVAAAGVWGATGVGKSALAVAFADRNVHAFPDGVFGVDLRNRRSAGGIVRRLMTAAGETFDEERDSDLTPAELMQIHFGARRCLLVLDNVQKEQVDEDAGDGSHFKHLIPHGKCCRLLVTSSDREVLTAFGIPLNAQVELRSLKPQETRAMLGALVGRVIANEEEEAVLRVGELTGHLPLALRLVAGLVANDVGPAPFAAMVDRLLQPGTRIDELTESDSRHSLRAVLDLSLERLESAEKQAFAQLSLCTANGFSRAAALATAMLEPREGRRRLSRLVNLGLLEYSASIDRFRFHPLIHILATEVARMLAVEAAAQRRHEEFFFNYVRQRSELNSRNVSELMAEEEGILASAESLARQGRFDFSFLAGLNILLEQTGNWAAGISLAKMGSNATTWKDRRLAAILALQAGKNYVRRGDLDQAISDFERSLKIEEELGNRPGIAMVLNSLGGARRDRGDLDQAISDLERSLAIGEELGHRLHIAMVLNSLGGARRNRGDLDQAISDFERSLEIREEQGDRRGIAMVLNSLGGARRDREDLDQAISDFERSLEIREEQGDRRGIAMVLNSLGGARRDRGDLDQAISDFERSLEIGEELGGRRHITMVLNSLGGARRDRGDLDEAIECYERSLAIQMANAIDIGRKSARANLRKLRKWRQRIADAVCGGEQSAILAEYHWITGKAQAGLKKDHYGAVSNLSRALMLNLEPDYQARCLADLAQSLFHLKLHREAAIYFREALDRGEDDTVLRASFGYTLHQLGASFDEVEEHFKAALAQNPNNLWASSWYALALCDSRMFEKAEEYARRAVEGRPEHSILLTNLARVLIATGDDEKQKDAESILKKALETAPIGFRYPQELLAELRASSARD